MTNRQRWTMTILTLSALAVGSIALVQAFGRIAHSHARTAVVLKELDTLEQSIARLRREAPQIQMWRDIASLCRRVRLEPEGWHSYPVFISRDLPWEEVAQSLLIASNALPRPGEYWFQPLSMRVARADAPQSTPLDGENAEKQPLSSRTERYNLNFQGHFLTPTHNQR